MKRTSSGKTAILIAQKAPPARPAWRRVVVTALCACLLLTGVIAVILTNLAAPASAPLPPVASDDPPEAPPVASDARATPAPARPIPVAVTAGEADDAPPAKRPADEVRLSRRARPVTEVAAAVDVRPVTPAPDVKPAADVKPPANFAPAAEARTAPANAAVKAAAAPLGQGDQLPVNRAIDKGLGYLRSHPWTHNTHSVGYSALAGLTMLECGAGKGDPLVQRAAVLVRAQAATLKHTYSLALTLLFLDRLGEAEDHRLIQGLALRLLAGQNAAGGWHYDCPLLPPSDMAQLYKFLRSHRPPALQTPLQAKDARPSPLALKKGLAKDPFRQFGDIVLTRGIESPAGSEQKSSSGVQPAALIVGLEKPAAPLPDEPPPPEVKAEAPMRLEALPPSLRKLPVVLMQDKTKTGLLMGRDDNSNTQFALLALWAARRHDVPTEMSLLHAQRRFHASQYPDGHWSYHLQGGHPSVAMTAVGLLGLAMGHGATAVMEDRVKGGAVMQDATIQKGLQYLGQNIGSPEPPPTALTPLPGLYFMWSVERVGVLYDLKTIGGKDWYRWGAQLLVAHQLLDGSWSGAHYPGASHHVDTCFALLFLKRSNLVQDLTENLRLYLPIRDESPGNSGR
jgi:hypothetical protein